MLKSVLTGLVLLFFFCRKNHDNKDFSWCRMETMRFESGSHANYQSPLPNE